MKIRINRILYSTKVEGPGTRCCIWVQGCPIHCKGCGAKETWSFETGQILDIEDIYNKIINLEGIEGITFLGGEPFAQAEAVYNLALMLKKVGLSVITFTGYTYEHILESEKKAWTDLLSVTDLLIDGPFIMEKFDLSRPWVGSLNQNYRFLTSKYKYLENNLSLYKNKIEVRLSANGGISINGMGNFEKIKKKLRVFSEGE